MNLPITSRIKRSPLLQTENEIATGSKTTKGKDKKVIKNVQKESSYDGPKMSDEDWKALTPEQRRKSNAAVGANEKGKVITNTKEEVITPGEDKVVDVDLKRKQYQDVMEGPWEQRRILRQGRMVSRQKSRYRKKLRKYGTFDEDGKFTRNSGLSQKELDKATQFEEGLNRSESARQRTDEGIASGKRPGSRIKRKEDRDATTGEFPDKEQTEIGARRQAREAEIAEQAGITTSQAVNAVKVEAPNPFSQALESAKDLGELDYKVGQYSSGINMKPSAFKMKAKSPAAKALKGNQSKLPQQLQDSIKAAPESPAKLGPLAAIAGKALVGALASKAASAGKMRSGFKMKGYGKK